MAAVELKVEGAVAQLLLNRPERHNAVDLALNAALGEATSALQSRADVRAVVVAGAGRSFCSGADLDVMSGLDPAAARRFMLDATYAFRRFEALPAPVIGAAKGWCLGGGFELLLHCDLVIAADSAVFAFPEVALGLVTTAGSVARLIDAIGTRRARDLLLTGRRVAADEALALGLCNEIVPAAELDARVLDKARVLAAQPAEGLAAMKRLVARHIQAAQTASFLAEVETFEQLLRARAAKASS